MLKDCSFNDNAAEPQLSVRRDALAAERLPTIGGKAIDGCSDLSVWGLSDLKESQCCGVVCRAVLPYPNGMVSTCEMQVACRINSEISMGTT